MTLRNGLAHTFTYISTHILAKRMTLNKQKNQHNFRIFNSHPREEDDIVSFAVCEEQRFFNSHPHEEDDVVVHGSTERIRFSTHILTRRMTKLHTIINSYRLFSTHILTRRMTFTTRNAFDYFTFFNSHPHEENDSNLNKIFSFKIKLYIHYNILFAIFYIYNSILYPFSSQKYSYSGANDSANSCSLAFRTPRFPVPSLQIHFP